MCPYLIIDVTGSLYYHQSETKKADSSEDELSDSSGNLSVVSDENFEVSSSSEDSVRHELENELAAIFSHWFVSYYRGPKLPLKFPANSDLKTNQGNARSYLWPPGL